MSRFLVDAQLPRRLARMMQAAGLDAVHTLDLPEGNRSKDGEINTRSLAEQRVVVTKDEDFVQSFLLQARPYKLLLVNTGNITNQELLSIFQRRLPQLAELFETYSFLELTREYLIIHS